MGLFVDSLTVAVTLLVVYYALGTFFTILLFGVTPIVS